MLGRVPGNIEALDLLKMASRWIFKYRKDASIFIQEVHGENFLDQAQEFICVPCQSTRRKKAIRESGLKPAQEVRLIEEPMAAAIGAGLPVEEASGSMVVYIGGGTTEIAILALEQL